MVSLVDALPSSPSLSELLDEELSEATNGAFLATHTLQPHATEDADKEIILKCKTNCFVHMAESIDEKYIYW